METMETIQPNKSYIEDMSSSFDMIEDGFSNGSESTSESYDSYDEGYEDQSHNQLTKTRQKALEDADGHGSYDEIDDLIDADDDTYEYEHDDEGGISEVQNTEQETLAYQEMPTDAVLYRNEATGEEFTKADMDMLYEVRNATVETYHKQREYATKVDTAIKDAGRALGMDVLGLALNRTALEEKYIEAKANNNYEEQCRIQDDLEANAKMSATLEKQIDQQVQLQQEMAKIVRNENAKATYEVIKKDLGSYRFQQLATNAINAVGVETFDDFLPVNPDPTMVTALLLGLEALSKGNKSKAQAGKKAMKIPTVPANGGKVTQKLPSPSQAASGNKQKAISDMKNGNAESKTVWDSLED